MRKAKVSDLKSQSNVSYVQLEVLILARQDEFAEIASTLAREYRLIGFQLRKPYRLGGGADVQIAASDESDSLVEAIVQTAKNEGDSHD